MDILFVCHGNICRSPMAQSVMAEFARRAGRDGEFTIDSAATSTEELGNPPHGGTVRTLEAHGIPRISHHARQVRKLEYDQWDLILCMDRENEKNLRRLFSGDPDHKVHRLLEYVSPTYHQGRLDVADPWYTGDFETTYADIEAGCRGLLESIILP